ncbi:MAG: hypothetical protein PV344_08040 [Anaplasma sp.]|nr:hypothetical protein [Anaplasma sp.]
MVDRVMRPQPHDLVREFQTTHNARVTPRVTRGVARGMKVIRGDM